MNRNDQAFIAQNIRARYTERKTNALDELYALDREVHRPAEILAYSLGIVGSLVMGAGMSLVMTDIGAKLGMTDTTVPGIVIGIVGMAMVVANYPIYKAFLGSRRERYADRVIALSNAIINR